MIRGHLRTDDQQITAAFDATPWFAQASRQDLIELAANDWSGIEAESVVLYLAEQREAEQGNRIRDKGVRKVYAYLERFKPLASKGVFVTFVAAIIPREALLWLRESDWMLWRELYQFHQEELALAKTG